MNQKKRGRKKDKAVNRVSLSFGPEQVVFLDALANALSNGRDTRGLGKHPALPGLATTVSRALKRTGQPATSGQSPVEESDESVVEILSLCTPNDLTVLDYVIRKLLASGDASIARRKAGFPILARKVRAKREEMGLPALEDVDQQRLASTG